MSSQLKRIFFTVAIIFVLLIANLAYSLETKHVHAEILYALPHRVASFPYQQALCTIKNSVNSNVNIRSQPSTQGSIVSTFAPNETIDVLEVTVNFESIEEIWYRIEFASPDGTLSSGWVFSELFEQVTVCPAIVTLNLSNPQGPTLLDPVLTVHDTAPANPLDKMSTTAIENTFLGLVDLGSASNTVVPELAISWNVDSTGTWTFTLRDDVYWVKYDPATRQVIPVRQVIAEDFIFGLQRACENPAVYQNYIISYAGFCGIQVNAANNFTLTFSSPPGDFLSVLTMWNVRPLPHEVIGQFGETWTDPANIWTNGPYLLIENDARGSLFIRNTQLPSDLMGSGNIDVVSVEVLSETAAFNVYQNNKLDSVTIPPVQLQEVMNSPQAQETRQSIRSEIFYFGYAHEMPPFDNVHVRRAFSAIIDRQAFIEETQPLGSALPASHFTPPGIVPLLPMDEVGVGYDPDFARQELELAGYPNCEGFPTINIITYLSATDWFEFWITAAEQELGCDRELFNVQEYEFPVLLEALGTSNRPHAWGLGYGFDYPDAENGFSDFFLYETGQGQLNRERTAVDDLIEQAAAETDPKIREQLYREIEEAFFGYEGEYPVAPLFFRSSPILVKSWYTGPFETDGIWGGKHWNAYTIDMETKLQATSE